MFSFLPSAVRYRKFMLCSRLPVQGRSSDPIPKNPYEEIALVDSQNLINTPLWTLWVKSGLGVRLPRP